MTQTHLLTHPTSLWDELESAWAFSDVLFDLVPNDRMLERPIPLRHPVLFYAGHLPAFAWRMLCSTVLGLESRNAAFEDLFEFGIDPEEGEEIPVVDPSAWPALDDVLAWRDEVRDLIRANREQLGEGDVRPQTRGSQMLQVVLEHELMHHETLLYMLHELPSRMLRCGPQHQPVLGGAVRPQREVRIPDGVVALGRSHGEGGFGWDNEFPVQMAEVPAFTLDARPVTIRDFLGFVQEGCYEDPQWWTPDAWRWIESKGRRRPKDWHRRGERWYVRSVAREVDIAAVTGWPVSVSHAEADAYARWQGARLPTEAELARAASTTPDGGDREYPWGDTMDLLGEPKANLGFRHWSPVPVGNHPEGDSAWGVMELLGNGWEWTSTVFAPAPGFQASIPSYEGYSADFFDGKHMVVAGAGWATQPRLARRSFRNWYRWNYPYPATKFRLVRS